MSIGDKVAHVKAAKISTTSKHTCHWTGCTKQVPPAMWGCSQHWFKLPLTLRNRVWACYSPGQEVTKTPSEEYVKVAKEIQEWIGTQK